MTDRIRTVTVVLDRDVRADDFEAIQATIRMIKGVSDVKPHVVTGTDLTARAIVASELRLKMFDAVAEVFDDGPSVRRPRTDGASR